MSVFGRYSSYYDLLYRDKDYQGEAEYIESIIGRFNPGAKSILDLGCGTGKHAAILAQKSYKVYGIDRSEDMLTIAREASVEGNPAYFCADVTQARIGVKVDIVTALFHVVSYQTSNEDLVGLFNTVREHLRPGGIFIFDFWYGPAVLTNKPEPRLKALEDETLLVYRFASPQSRPNEDIVDVKYKVIVKDKKSGQLEELSELHSMRYLFMPEVHYMLGQCGLKAEYFTEWITENEPGHDTWSVVGVAHL